MMGRSILASAISLFLFAVPTFAAERSAEASDKTATANVVNVSNFVSADGVTSQQPTLSAAISSEAATTPLAASPAPASATALRPDWWRGSRPSALPALYVGSVVLQAFDAYSTLKVVGLGGNEANPVMRSAASNPAALIGVKAVVTAASILAAERMWKDHHRTGAVVTMVVSNGFMALVAAHNASVISGLQR